jgi:hypothetical protein
MGKLKILRVKVGKVNKDIKYLVAYNGKALSGHRTEKGARDKYNRLLRIAKS